MKSSKLNRRLFLRGLGGMSVAAPFLSSLTEQHASAQSVAALPPRRLIVMFTHYGCMTDRWFPSSAHGPLTADSFSGLTTEPLAPYANKLLMPRGIRAMNEWTADLSRGQGNDSHGQVVGSYFTCHPVTPNSNDPFQFTSSTRVNYKPTGPSLDHVCAKQVSPGQLPLFARVGGTNDDSQSAISYSAAEESFPGISIPAQAFSLLVNGFLNGQAMNEDTYRTMRGKSIMDIVKDDLDTLERLNMSESDNRKLQAWQDLLSDTIVQSVRSAQCSEETALALGLSEENLELSGMLSNGQDRVTQQITDNLDAADIYSNIAALTALCDANRVIFLKYPAGYIFRGLGLETESHGLSHRVGAGFMGGDCSPNANEQLMTLDRYYAEKFAHLVKTLDDLPEGDGSVLDNCAAVWFQEMSDGNAHNLNNMPIIQAGGCGGYFKVGQAINVEDGDPNLSRGNSSLFCQSPGESIPTSEVTASGTPPEFGNASINKYYCNLMNALGVKAGSDGFPLEGGTEQVTCFGKYDATEDFIGGDVNPPLIRDPGEFDVLKA